MGLSSVVKDRILSDIAARGDEREGFLAQLVQTPSSNPPGDCAPIAEVAGRLLEGLGLKVERHVVPDDLVRAAGMVPAPTLSSGGASGTVR